jgi:hypothetical protein
MLLPLANIIYAPRELELLEVIAPTAERDSGSVFPGARYTTVVALSLYWTFDSMG